MAKQRKREYKERILTSALSAVLVVTGCITVPNPAQAAGKTELQNPRIEYNYCDTVEFGSYWQEDTNGDGKVNQKDAKQPIRWRILSQEGNDAYVIADKVLDCKPYNKKRTDVTWETSTLRNWLNSDFYNTAFSTQEQEAIIEQTLVNEDNTSYATVPATKGGNNTKDKLYLPSISDMQNTDYGFLDDSSGNQARMGEITSYAKEQIADLVILSDQDVYYTWWLRSPGSDQQRASKISDSGYVNTDGYYVDYADQGGVRPVMHLNLSSSHVTKKGRIEVSLKRVEWDTVELGNFEGFPITWRVLSVKGNDVFLLSDEILTNKAYNEKYKGITWADSSLRAWLNGEFYNNAFSAAEKKGIIKTVYKNADNPKFIVKGGVDTKDCVTLLSLKDIVKKEYGFAEEYDCTHPGRIACGESGYSESGDGGWWWLRSPGSRTKNAARVCSTGLVSVAGYRIDNSEYKDIGAYGVDDIPGGGVRPAMHVKLSSSSLKKKGTVVAEAGVKLVNSGNKDKRTTINIQDRKTYKTSQKLTVKDQDGIKTIQLNKKTIKVKNKKNYSFKLSKYKKYLKKKGKWNKLVVTDKNGKKMTIKFKTK